MSTVSAPSRPFALSSNRASEETTYETCPGCRRLHGRRSLPDLSAATATAAHAPVSSKHHQAAPQAQVWLTTADGAQKLRQQEPVAFHPGASDLTTITVDPNQSFQRMDGFGGALTDSSAHVLAQLPRRARDNAMQKLFDPKEGIGVGFVRQPVGSSDFTAAATHYTYDDVPAGQTDFALRHFSIAHDQQQIPPLLRQAKKLNPQLTVMATPWSPPAWMKDNDSLVGGTSRTTRRCTTRMPATW